MNKLTPHPESGTATPQPIRVMLVDKHIMVRRGLATILMVFDDLQLVGETESGEAAIQLCSEVLPDVILMEMVMPDMDGASITRAIHQKFPQIQVIALTSFTNGEMIKSALEAGVIGYLIKDLSAYQIVQAIRGAISSRATISAEAAQALVQTDSQSLEPILDLTEPDREALSLMIDGLNMPQISRPLIVHSSTSKTHVTNFMSKLSIANYSETVTPA